MPKTGNNTKNNTARLQRSAKRAFTLIELLAASLLAAMLMLVIVGLLRTTHAQSDTARWALEDNPSTSILADQIRRDFVNAREIEMYDNRVRLSGYMAHDARTGRQTFRRAEVTYAVVSSRRNQWLVRQETQFNEVVGKRSSQDVLWAGVSALNVETFADSAAASKSAKGPKGMTPMPAHVVVEILDRDAELIFREDIFHHLTVQ